MFHSTECTDLTISNVEVEETMQSSFIVQSVQRLFDQRALTQTFYSPLRRRSCHKLRIIGMVKEKTVTTEEHQDYSTPVMKLLQPEFRHQLVVSRSSSESSKDPTNIFRNGFNQQAIGDNCAAVETQKENSPLVKSMTKIPVSNNITEKPKSSISISRDSTVTCDKIVEVNTTDFDGVDACNRVKKSVLPVQPHILGDTSDKVMKGKGGALESMKGNGEAFESTKVMKGNGEAFESMKAIKGKGGAFESMKAKKGKGRAFESTKAMKGNGKAIESTEENHVDTCDNVKNDGSLPLQLKVSNSEKDPEKHGHIFLVKLDEQVKELECIACQCEEDLKGCDSEEGKGELRATAGKARLLIAEKLKQFRGLCEKNISNSDTDGFPTMNEDLAGFWDMVSIQVDEIMRQYERTKTLKENNWKTSATEGKGAKQQARKIPATRPKAQMPFLRQPVKPQSEVTKARDIARRKMLQEKRQALMKQTHCPANSNLPDTLKTV